MKNVFDIQARTRQARTMVRILLLLCCVNAGELGAQSPSVADSKLESATSSDPSGEASLRRLVGSDAYWALVWNDEFNGEQLDRTKWECEVNAFGGGNNELQMYTDRPTNVSVSDGQLHLIARRDNPNIGGTTRDYSSGRIRSKYRGDWKYGLFVIAAKAPQGAGLWPAIWMLPTDEVYGTWASSGEIDIVEIRGQTPQEVLGTLHYGATWPNNLSTSGTHTFDQGDSADGIHEYAIQWSPSRIDWYIDGVKTQTQTKWSSEGGPFPAPFDERFHLLLNLAVGGGFVGPVAGDTSFPAEMTVDYVRVYQRRE